MLPGVQFFIGASTIAMPVIPDIAKIYSYPTTNKNGIFIAVAC